MTARIGLILILALLVAVPLFLCVGNALAYLGARVLGGTGAFGPQIYLMSLFYLPLGIASSLVPLIPSMRVFPFVSIGASIYTFVLQVRTLRVVHRLTTGRAVAALLWPLLLPVCICGVLLLSGPAVGNVFSTVIENLGTPTP